MTPPQHFLLIDDNVADQLLAQEAFGQLCPDCTLRIFSGGRSALDWLQSAPDHPDVILLDVNMPEMNGFEVLQELKRDPRLALIPVVMLSTSGAQGDVATAYTLHASSYLVKAPRFDEFLKQIDTFLTYWRETRLAHA
ncbi:response regulator [Deinococcus sp. MIMF12]|uniref:Response regulator n=1 Tax=Deinococcus rhizophilus TaxID=3049544 RepID=A0ABT7JHD1_9DEIO|nr:response regulator [Deinococcus rhizophilus]MDL2344466.1 response regulator [Deinococcus rhizophilus]